MGYLSLLRTAYVLRLLAGTLVGRLPSAMAALAIPLALRQEGVSYGFVGLAAGTFAIAMAAGGPLLGRLVDRAGQPRVLIPTAVLAGLGFALIALAPDRPAWVLAGAVLAGAATPPLEPCLRALWPRIVRPERLQAAYALDAGAQELIFVGAPLLVAACVAVALPTTALWVSAALGALGVAVVVTARPVRAWRADAHSTHWLGPLRSRGLLVLLIALAGAGTAIGTLNVSAIAYAEGHPGIPGGAGTLLAVNATGALAGAIAFGALRWTAPLPRQVVAVAAGLAAGYGLLPLVPAPPWMLVLMFVTGLFLAPLLTVSFLLVDGLAPPGTITEAFAWVVTVFTTGVALGSAVAGAMLERAGPHWAASAGALSTLGGVLVLLAGRRLLRDRRPAEPALPAARPT